MGVIYTITQTEDQVWCGTSVWPSLEAARVELAKWVDEHRREGAEVMAKSHEIVSKITRPTSVELIGYEFHIESHVFAGVED